MISAVSTSNLPAINGNSLFWVMAALILAEAVAVVKLAGALYRSRHVQIAAAVPGDEPGYPQAIARRQDDDAPERPRRRRRHGRLLGGVAVIATILWVADKVTHFKASAAPGAAASPSARPQPSATTRLPSPRPSVSPLTSGPPVTATHTASHFPLTGTEIVIIAALVILGLVAYGINRVQARER